MSAVIGIVKKILVPIVVVIFTAGLGIALLLSGWLPYSVQLSTGEDTPTVDITVPETAHAAAAEDNSYYQVPEQFQMVGGIYYDTGQRIVNLADAGGFRYLRISIVLEFLPDNPEYYQLEGEELVIAQETFQEGINRQRPLIDDVILNVLTRKKFDEIFTVEGKEQLREEIREEMNKAMLNRHIQRVLITDFVVQ